MAVPSPVGRADPVGTKIADGFSSKITITSDPNIDFWEKQVTPPAVEGGDPVEQTTMFNSTWRTALPPDLKSLESVTATVAYDPEVYNQIIAIINANTTITVTWPDGSTLAFFGWLRRFEPAALVDADQPEATVTFEVSNLDPSDVRIEAGPVMTEVSGTAV